MILYTYIYAIRYIRTSRTSVKAVYISIDSSVWISPTDSPRRDYLDSHRRMYYNKSLNVWLLRCGVMNFIGPIFVYFYFFHERIRLFETYIYIYFHNIISVYVYFFYLERAFITRYFVILLFTTILRHRHYLFPFFPLRRIGFIHFIMLKIILYTIVHKTV